MSERGGVHTFHPTWTEPDPLNPDRRITKESPNWHWRFSYAGKRYFGGTGPDGFAYKSRTAARDAGEARLAEVRQGYEQDPRKATWTTLEGIIRAHCKGDSAATAESMETCVSRLAPFFKNDRLRDIDETRLLQYRDHQLAPGAKREGEGYQPSTIKLDLSFLRRGMLIAFRKRLIMELPAMPKFRRRKRKAMFRPDEMEQLVSTMPEHWRRFFLIAAEIGWRARSELRTRKWTDVTEDFIHLDADTSKTREARVFPMTNRLRQLLLDQRAWVDSLEKETGRIVPWVCPREDGRQLGEYTKAWATACKRAGWGNIEGRTGPWSSVKVAHDIRRTAMNRWEGMGVAAGARQAMSGHSAESTYHDYYQQASVEDLKRAAERIDAAREAEEPPKVVSIKGGSKP